MLAVALNHAGTISDGQTFGPVFARTFPEFKAVKLVPIDGLKTGPLELCQPVGYEEIKKDIIKTCDRTGTFLELTGRSDKLQRAVRQMFFFDQETKFNNILFHGCNDINDFPWAMQILIVQLPVVDWKQDSTMIKMADVLIINSSKGNETEEFITKVKKIRPHIPIYVEKIEERLSRELQENLMSLFAAYEEKRSMVKTALREKYPKQIISCEQARGMARKLKVSTFLLGNVCDECGYKVANCGLGCF
ncbi:MAG TPA: hypothetical protein VN426_17815 [Syntrophomonadaceae bacterium]|nr:hypothetical protein [Syntrophomonadaceae bacterium]